MGQSRRRMPQAIEPRRGIDDEPTNCAQSSKHGRSQKRCPPTKVSGNHGRERCSYGATQLAAGIHSPGHNPGVLPREIGGDRPEAALRQIQGPCSTRENKSGSLSIVRSRPDGKQKRRAGQGEGRQKAPAGAQADVARETVAGHSAGKRAKRHGDKGKHGVDRAGLQIQAAHLNQIDIKPAKENPGHVTERKIASRQGENLFASKYSAPRYPPLPLCS